MEKYRHVFQQILHSTNSSSINLNRCYNDLYFPIYRHIYQLFQQKHRSPILIGISAPQVIVSNSLYSTNQ